jgi:O-antigen/teichoic acid export membrane protein
MHDAVGMAVGPFYSKLYTSKKTQAEFDGRALTFLLMSGFLLATFLVSLWLKEIFAFLIRNEELKNAYGIGIIILMAYSYKPMYWSSGIKLSLYEKTGMLWRISFVAGLINLVLNLVFVPFYGIYAAAVITFVSLLYMGFSGFYFKSYKKIQSVDYYPFWWMLAICIFTVTAMTLRDVHYGIKLVVSIGLLSGAGYYFFRNYARLQAIDI